MTETIKTIREFKTVLDKAHKVYAWVMIWGNDGEYLEVSKRAVRKALNIEVPFHRDGAHDDGMAPKCDLRDAEVAGRFDLYLN